MGKPEMVFALYRPHAGKDAELEEVLKRHVPTLKSLELATDRPSFVARAGDGTYVEVFEWADGEAARRAHDLPAVAAVWEAIGQVADLRTLADLEETRRPFPHFQTVW